MRISDWSSDVCSSDLTAAIHFDGVRVPAENLIGPENGGFIGIMRNFNSERLGMAMGCCAYARVAMAEAAEWARNRATFGNPLDGHQRSEERRVGKECGSQCRSRLSAEK